MAFVYRSAHPKAQVTRHLMKPNLLKEGVITDSSDGSGPATRRVLRERAVELALINGRSVLEVSKFDWDQARRELTGEPAAKPGGTDENL